MIQSCEKPYRTRDNGAVQSHFLDNIIVACPRCDSPANVKPIKLSEADLFAPRRVTCSSCSFSRATTGLDIFSFRRDGRDPFTGLPVWLQTQTRHGLVFALNKDHLQALETYIANDFDEPHLVMQSGLHGHDIVVLRLPNWMKSVENKQMVKSAFAQIWELAEVIPTHANVESLHR